MNTPDDITKTPAKGRMFGDLQREKRASILLQFVELEQPHDKTFHLTPVVVGIRIRQGIALAAVLVTLLIGQPTRITTLLVPIVSLLAGFSLGYVGLGERRRWVNGVRRVCRREVG